VNNKKAVALASRSYRKNTCCTNCDCFVLIDRSNLEDDFDEQPCWGLTKVVGFASPTNHPKKLIFGFIHACQGHLESRFGGNYKVEPTE